ncbi:unnamed protein product [Microthlaspi erraticum]|uniref:Uncharacterized protein n=1 Tax=Microthlaspi erraticum TaxID=1685480 RepID=A0A6D2J019_9BRAS|nr:unnamed protein product [Microthlaspi erraticum]
MACVLFGFLAATILLVLLFYPPDTPEVTLASLTVTKFNFTGDHISGNFNIQFQSLNPNLGTDFFYKDVDCSVYYGKHRLASTVLSGFAQKERETKLINATVHLTQGTTAKGIGNDLTIFSVSQFDVTLTSLIEWEPWSFYYLRFSCDDVAVGFLATTGGHGKMIGPARKCQVSKISESSF